MIRCFLQSLEFSWSWRNTCRTADILRVSNITFSLSAVYRFGRIYRSRTLVCRFCKGSSERHSLRESMSRKNTNFILIRLLLTINLVRFCLSVLVPMNYLADTLVIETLSFEMAHLGRIWLTNCIWIGYDVIKHLIIFKNKTLVLIFILDVLCRYDYQVEIWLEMIELLETGESQPVRHMCTKIFQSWYVILSLNKNVCTYWTKASETSCC